MIQHVYQRALQARFVAEVWVATDDARIAEAVRGFGGNVLMTSPQHTSGTQRVFEAATRIKGDTFVNLQGDEPLILPQQIDQVIEVLKEDPKADVSSLRVATEVPAEIFSPNCVKVVVDHRQYALYFSRAPIPFYRFYWDSKERGSSAPDAWGKAWIHIGLYAFRRATIDLISTMCSSPWEEAEQLEQLRFLHWGCRILVPETAHRTLGVDIPEDIARAERALLQGISDNSRHEECRLIQCQVQEDL
jgi:3-deoxy-manno-octulosonate cytidylyltransferase (CMP-KDO synthetase)